MAELEQAGFVERIERRASHGGKTTNLYDLTGLVKKLKELEPEFAASERRAREERVTVGKAKYRRRSQNTGTRGNTAS